MKKLLGLLFISFFVLGIFSGLLYLKEQEPDTYSRIMGIPDGSTQTKDNGLEIVNSAYSDNAGGMEIQKTPSDSGTKTEKEKKATENNGKKAKKATNKAAGKDASNKKAEPNKLTSDTNRPITEKARGNIPKKELQAVQKADMVPLEGTGKEVDAANSAIDEGALGGDYTFSELLYPYRAMLDSEEQKAYDQIYANALSYNSEHFAIQASVNATQIDDIMQSVYNDHPELFWLETQYDYQYGSNGIVYSIRLNFNETIEDIDKNVAVFNEKVNEIINLAKDYKTDVEKERFVHDYLINTTTYDENAPMHQSAYSALVNGRSVCAGYSRAFQHILMQMGIPVYYCTGVADGGTHAWNIIKLGNNFYNVDTLWDDSVEERYGTECYLYYNMPDSEFNIEHKRTGLSVNLPDCTETDMEYDAVFSSNIMGDNLAA
ncbi:transglutaminase domain-containing protein [Anaerocolumna xylanovorans]|uniref:Transglutaminase-like superfamily protein n=1 Tax=Anaerocolumna xylanovorans DSM 12503 TaxID=1121345 RepID=A0A1M7Y0W8_9FIRM|nr:transglutaminase domain-containing protein [Anaerocolumna xylanovorans]SHO45319.1 Transglutaminase-like superfamily protein [Anaerocolumna xylanovorans DSM 12503]